MCVCVIEREREGGREERGREGEREREHRDECSEPHSGNALNSVHLTPHTHAHTRTHTAHTHTHTHTHTRTHTHTHARTRTHAHTHARTHARTHTHRPPSPRLRNTMWTATAFAVLAAAVVVASPSLAFSPFLQQPHKDSQASVWPFGVRHERTCNSAQTRFTWYPLKAPPSHCVDLWAGARNRYQEG